MAATLLPSNAVSTLETTATKLAPSLATLQSYSANYSKLQTIERSLDWTIERRMVEVKEVLDNDRLAGVDRKLRIGLTTRIRDQIWQLPADAVVAPPLDVSTAAGGDARLIGVDENENGSMPIDESRMKEDSSNRKLDFSTGAGIPRWEVDITGELVDDVRSHILNTEALRVM